MHEQENGDIVFTPDMRNSLAQEFNLKQSPAVIAGDADRFVLSLPIPKATHENKPLEDIGYLMGQQIFMQRFIEEHFRNGTQGSMKEKARKFAVGFYNWKHTLLDKYEESENNNSRKAARIVKRITLDKLYNFISTQSEKHAMHRKNAGLDSTQYIDSREKASQWENYERVARFAVRWDSLQPSVPIPRK